jgi:hypothetical protein
MELAVLLKNSAPVINAFPSLSTDGLALFAPRYLSSNESKLAAAAVAELAELVALEPELVADVAELVADVAAAAALVAASEVEPNNVSV